MSRLLLAFVGVIIASLFLVGERPIKEPFVNATAQVIKSFLKYAQYDKGRIMIGFYNILLLNRVRRLRTDGDTTLDKDITRGLIDQIKERSRWDNFEKWMVSCMTTAGTPMEDNLIARVATLPVDPMNYLRFMNALVTLYREEIALIKNQKPVAWTRREIDEGTAEDNYTPPGTLPNLVGPDMQKFLVEHIKVLDKLWPLIEKLAVRLTQETADMNTLLNAREKMPNGFTMRIYVDFEEKIFQKPLADVMKFMINHEAESRQFDADGVRQMTLENAKIAVTMDFVKLSNTDFTPWFVPIYKGQKKTYKERFETMGFNPGNYLKLANYCLLGLQTQVTPLRSNLKPVVEKKALAEAEEAEAFTDQLLYEHFQTSSVLKQKGSLAPEDQPLTGQVRDIVYRRFAILGQAEPAFKEQISACNKLMNEIQNYKDGIKTGKYTLGTDNPLSDDDLLSESEGFKFKGLSFGNVL